MAYTTIDDPSEYFQTALWSGDNATTQDITNDGNSDLQPDWVWVKCRNTSGNGFDHTVWDTSRGVDNNLNKSISTSQPDNQGLGDNVTTTAQLGGVSAMLSDGFTVREGSIDNDSRYVNESSRTYVGWQWKANGGTKTSFSESGNNPAGTHQANTTAGFSIVTSVGTGSAGTIAHGLSAAPEWILTKGLDQSHAWITAHKSQTFSKSTLFNSTDAFASGSEYNNTDPTSSVFTVKDQGGVNNDGENYVHYLFHSVQGYSKFGTYTGNGNADGAFVYTGFKPAWLMYKQTNAGTRDWVIVDNKRDPVNVCDEELYANRSDATGDVDLLDFVSNGFKCRRSHNSQNGDGDTYVYMAFAEHPFVSSKGVPVTAR